MRMSVDLFVRICFGVLFVATLIAGYFLFKNFEKLLGRDPEFPNDSAGARSLNKVQVIVIWLHILAITGGFALFLH
jgi:uncharacterized membrane protein SpoIIM required for sporulation